MSKKKDLKPAPAYQWYPRDMNSLEGISVLDNEAYGLFRRLYDHAWLNDGLPADVDAVYPFARCASRKKFDQLWMQIEPLFPPNGDGRRRNPQQEEQRGSRNKFKRQRQLAAKERWRKERELRNARALHPHYENPLPVVHVESSALALSSALAPVNPDQNNKAEVQAAPHRRVARMRLSIWEVRNHLIAATHRLLDHGEPYVDRLGVINLTELGHAITEIAAKDLRAEWNSSRELQGIIDTVIARRKRLTAADHLKDNFDKLERRALRRLGRVR